MFLRVEDFRAGYDRMRRRGVAFITERVSGLDQAEPVRRDDCLCAVAQLQLVQDVPQVGLHGG
jgi:hypothetical protein